MMKAGSRSLTVGAIGTGVAMLFAAVALATPKSGGYHGPTTQTGQPKGTVKFRVTDNHGDVHNFAGDIWASGENPGQPVQTIHITLNPSPNMAIRAGRFGFKGIFNIDNGPVVIARHVNGSIAGKFTAPRQVTGTMNFKWTFDDGNAPAPFPGYRCTTGTADFAAKRN